MLKAAVHWVGSGLAAAELNDPRHAGSWLFALSGKHIQYDSKDRREKHYMVEHNTAQHIPAKRSAAQHSTAQHSAAQRSTAQRSAAQHIAAHTARRI